MSYHRLYRVHWDMVNRCYRQNLVCYPHYGGRGIRVCEEWLADRTAFFAWALSHGYKDGLVIDRIDNEGGYSPENCRWVTPLENLRNRRTVRRTSADAAVVKWMALANVPQKLIAALFCVSCAYVSQIKTGRKWPGVENHFMVA